METCPLTVRQLQIVSEIASGKVRKTIAGDLNISESAVCLLVRDAADRAKVARKDAALIATALRRGWII